MKEIESSRQHIKKRKGETAANQSLSKHFLNTSSQERTSGSFLFPFETNRFFLNNPRDILQESNVPQERFLEIPEVVSLRSYARVTVKTDHGIRVQESSIRSFKETDGFLRSLVFLKDCYPQGHRLRSQLFPFSCLSLDRFLASWLQAVHDMPNSPKKERFGHEHLPAAPKR